jgi:hypothetical protein
MAQIDTQVGEEKAVESPQVHAQAGPLGQCLLCQAGRLSMLTEQIAKGGRRAGEHSRASLSQGFQRADDPPACTPA